MVIADIVQHHKHDWQEGVLSEQGHELGQHARVDDSLPVGVRVGAGITGEPQYLQHQGRPQRLLCREQGQEEV